MSSWTKCLQRTSALRVHPPKQVLSLHFTLRVISVCLARVALARALAVPKFGQVRLPRRIGSAPGATVRQ